MLSVGSLTACKAHADLLDACPQLSLNIHPFNSVLLARGERNRPYGPESEPWTRVPGDILGHRQDVPDLIQACDLFVFPSAKRGWARPCSTRCLRPPDRHDQRRWNSRCGRHAARWTVRMRLDRSARRTHGTGSGDPAAPGSSRPVPLMTEAAERRAHERFTTDHMVDETLRTYYDLLASRSHTR